MASAGVAELERVLFRLSMTDDKDLENVVNKLLPIIIKRMSTQVPAERKKCMEIVSHVNKRIRTLPKLQLPVAALMDMYGDAATPPMPRSFAIVYLQQGLARLESDAAAAYLPRLMSGVHALNSVQQQQMLQIIVAMLPTLKVPREDDPERERVCAWAAHEADRRVLLAHWLDYLLLFPISAEQPVPGGLSPAALAHVTAKRGVPERGVLTTRKLAILNLISQPNLLPPNSIVPHLVACCGGFDHEVTRRGGDELKRCHADWEDAALLGRLFAMFHGTEHSDPAQARVGGNVAMRIRIVTLLCRSVAAASMTAQALRLMLWCVYSKENTTAKLRALGCEFTRWVLRHATDDALKPMAQPLFKQLLNTAADTPSPRVPLTRAEEDLRTFTFSALGQLVRRCAFLTNSDVRIPHLLFHAVCTEPVTVRHAVREALSVLAAVFENPKKQLEADLVKLLMDYVRRDEVHARFAAVQWANRLFPMDHIASRYVCLLAVDDEKVEVRDEARRGVDPTPAELDEAKSRGHDRMPSFGEMVLFLHEKMSAHAPRSRADGAPALVFADRMHMHMLRFVWRCLVWGAAKRDVCVATFVTRYDDAVLTQYRHMLVASLVPKISPQLISTATRQLYHLARFAPGVVLPYCATRVDWLCELLRTTVAPARIDVGRLIGLLSAHEGVDTAEVASLVRQLVATAKDANARLEHRHGACVALGSAVGRLHARGAEADTCAAGVAQLYELMEQTAKPLLAIGSCMGLGLAGECGPLPVHEGGPTRAAIAERLIGLLVHDNKVAEAALHTMGQVGVGDRDVALLRQLVDGILALKGNRFEDVQFAAGEALASLAVGMVVQPPSEERLFDEVVAPSVDMVDDVAEATAERVLKTVLGESIGHVNQHVRNSACVWLLLLVRYAQRHVSVRSRLEVCQMAFTQLLGETNEFTQECASKGLSLIYDIGDADGKKQLLESLTDMLSGKVSATQKMTDANIAELQMPAGAQGKGKITTYKELCSVATEMGKPDFVYTLLGLASHHAAWRSRKGAAFGFAAISKRAKDELAPHLDKLVPSLYRYQYDPNEKVRRAMGEIWRAVVDDEKQTIDTHFDAIMSELLTSMGGRQWRVREASATALGELIRARRMDQLGDHLRRVWKMVFRSIDDVKESVRKAGEATCRTLVGVSTRLCDPEQTVGSEGRRAVDVVLDVLLHEGIVSDVQEVRSVGIRTLVAVSSNAGEWLRPHIPKLAGVLLESLSSLEPKALSYAQFHAEKLNITQEHLEQARVSVAGASPISETLDRCARMVDPATFDELLPRLCEILKRGTGLPTRAGTARFVHQLCTQYGKQLRDHAGALLKSLRSGLKDTSSAVRKAYATALAGVLRISKKRQALQLVQEMVQEYEVFPADGQRQAVAILFRELSRRAGDTLKRYAIDVLPVAFLGRHDPHEGTRSTWESVWDDNTGGVQSGCLLYASEIVAAIDRALGSSSWHIKSMAALALADLATSLHTQLDVDLVMPVLNKALAGRIYDGKEAVLKAFAAVCKAGKDKLVARESRGDKNKPSALELVTLLGKHCQRKAFVYRKQAIEAMAAVLDAFGDLGVYDEVAPLGYALFVDASAKPPSGDAADGAEVSEEEKKSGHLLRVAALTMLRRAFPLHDVASVQQVHLPRLAELLARTAHVGSVPEKLATLLTLLALVRDVQPAAWAPADMAHVLRAVKLCSEHGKFVKLRSSACDVADAVADAAGRGADAVDRAELRVLVDHLLKDDDVGVRAKAREVATKL